MRRYFLISDVIKRNFRRSTVSSSNSYQGIKPASYLFLRLVLLASLLSFSSFLYNFVCNRGQSELSEPLYSRQQTNMFTTYAEITWAHEHEWYFVMIMRYFLIIERLWDIFSWWWNNEILSRKNEIHFWNNEIKKYFLVIPFCDN